MFEQRIPITLTVLSPVHVGTGEDYIPTEYVIKDGYLHVLNRDAFMDYLIKEGKYQHFLFLCNISSPEGIFKIRQFIYDHFRPEFSVYKVKVSQAVAENYSQNLSDYAQIETAVIASLAIAKLPRNPLNHQVFIPGSSLKGSLRTAILNYLCQSQKGAVKQCLADHSDKPRQNKARILEQCILKKASANDTCSDPFRALKVSDLKMTKGNIKIDISYNLKSFQTQKHAQGIPVKMEYIAPGAAFTGTITIHKALFERQYAQITGLKTSLDQKTLITACRYHYQNIWAEEKERFHISAATTKDYQMWAPLPEKLNNPKLKQACFIKLGKHSGAAAVTIAGFRKIVGGKDFQTTIWALDNMPMAWCLLETNG